MGLSSTNFGAAIVAQQNAFPGIRYRLGLGDDESKLNTYETILQTAAILGLAIGSVLGGKMIGGGRRSVIMKFNIVAIFTSLTSVLSNFWIITLSRLVFGFSAGVLVSATPKVIDETIPTHLLDKGFGISTNLFINVIILGQMLIGMGQSNEPAKLSKSNYWMIFFLI